MIIISTFSSLSNYSNMNTLIYTGFAISLNTGKFHQSHYTLFTFLTTIVLYLYLQQLNVVET